MRSSMRSSPVAGKRLAGTADRLARSRAFEGRLTGTLLEQRASAVLEVVAGHDRRSHQAARRRRPRPSSTVSRIMRFVAAWAMVWPAASRPTNARLLVEVVGRHHAVDDPQSRIVSAGYGRAVSTASAAPSLLPWRRGAAPGRRTAWPSITASTRPSWAPLRGPDQVALSATSSPAARQSPWTAATVGTSISAKRLIAGMNSSISSRRGLVTAEEDLHVRRRRSCRPRRVRGPRAQRCRAPPPPRAQGRARARARRGNGGSAITISPTSPSSVKRALVIARTLDRRGLGRDAVRECARERSASAARGFAVGHRTGLESETGAPWSSLPPEPAAAWTCAGRHGDPRVRGARAARERRGADRRPAHRRERFRAPQPRMA